MKISFTYNAADSGIVYKTLHSALDNVRGADGAILYDDLTIELPDDSGSTIEDIPPAIQDLINDAIDELAQDFGIDLEIDTVSES